MYFKYRSGRGRMVIGFKTTYAISAYCHKHCEFKPGSGKVNLMQHYVIKFVSNLRQVGSFSLVSSTNKTDCHNITEILLKVALSTIKPKLTMHMEIVPPIW